MEKRYDPSTLEGTLYQTWEAHDHFQAQGQGEPYCIMIPPPNVTGVLHMGHGFQFSVQDALIRHARMQGKNTLWQVGTDHAGIATQMVVERQLLAKQQSRHDLGRETFIQKIWDWKAHSGGQITQQMRRLGISVDWQRECFTMDEARTQAVNSLFIKLFEDGLIYRGQRLVNWDPILQTAISDLEVVAEEVDGHLWHIRYPLSDATGELTVATTRPETMLGDVAVAVHPDDDRYQHLIGQSLNLPLCDRAIPIIADSYVDPKFGTGCVKITPAHDFNDYAMGQRHHLPMINILTPSAHLNDNVPLPYQGLDRNTARKQIITDLEHLGMLAKTETHQLTIPRGDRSQSIIEPYLTQQWFVKADKLAGPARDAVATGNIKFVPKNWEKTYFQWLDNIEDWCISRQLWWGHQIPAWYDDEGNIYVGANETTVREQHKLAPELSLRQDEDVLDTWFSSALWPFSSLGWPEQTEALKTFYPSNVLVTGFDIIFFWVARMVMMGLYVMGEVPFKEVYITPLIRDAQGQKMSKSKGNALDPIDLIDGIDLDALVKKSTQHLMQPKMAKAIEKNLRRDFPDGIPAFGTDALRFMFCALASPGRNINFDLDRIAGYRNFCNKLWNAARFVFMHFEQQDSQITSPPLQLSTIDRWLISELQRTTLACAEHFKNYRFDLLCKALYEFTWHSYCDWYLELVKPVLNGDDSAAKAASCHTLIHSLETLLRLMHPIMPFITEAIWQQAAPLCGLTDETIMLQAYPQAQSQQIDTHAENEVTWLQAMITAIRTIRAEMNISPARTIPVLLHQGGQEDRQQVITHTTLLSSLAKLTSIEWVVHAKDLPPAATALVGQLEIHIPLAGLIDAHAEMARLNKAIQKLEKQLQQCDKKLSNSNFTDKAPAEVVAKEQTAAKELRHTLQKLCQQRQQIAAMVVA